MLLIALQVAASFLSLVSYLLDTYPVLIVNHASKDSLARA